MNDTKIVTVTGAPGSGKTTWAQALAYSLEAAGAGRVLLLHTDFVSPPLITFGPGETRQEGKTLSRILLSPTLTRATILREIRTVRGHPNLGFLGYGSGDAGKALPIFGEAQGRAVIEELANVTDYLIVDGSSYTQGDILESCVLPYSDVVINLRNPSLRSLAWEKMWHPEDIPGQHVWYVKSATREGETELWNLMPDAPAADEGPVCLPYFEKVYKKQFECADPESYMKIGPFRKAAAALSRRVMEACRD